MKGLGHGLFYYFFAFLLRVVVWFIPSGTDFFGEETRFP